MKALYAVYNKNCGHLLHAGDDRPRAEQLIAALTVAGKWGYRIKTSPDDTALESLIRGDRCGVCSLDGSTGGGSILFMTELGSAP